MKNRSIKILIISDAITSSTYSTDKIDGIEYSIQIEFCKRDLRGIEAKCDDEFDIILSETYDFTNLKQKHNTLNDNVCKNFFGFRGRFILLNCHIDGSQIRNYDTAFFPNCKTFKRKEYTKHTKWDRFKDIFSGNGTKIWAKITSFSCAKYSEKEIQDDTNFLLFLKKEVKKYIAVEKDYIFNGILFIQYMLSWKRSHRIWLQLTLLVVVSWLFLSNDVCANNIKNQFKNIAPFFGSQLFKANISAIKPVSIIITIITCFLYWLWYVRDLFEDINKEISPKGFKILYYGAFPILAIIILILGFTLFGEQIRFSNEFIYSHKSEYFLFKGYFIVGLLAALDAVVLLASRAASRSEYITKHTQTKLINSYDLAFQTIVICDIPILIGTFILSHQEQFITVSESRTAYQIGATASSLFILQLIYFFINWKSSYEDYLSS